MLDKIPPYPWHPSWIEISLAQFKKNIAAIRQKIGNRLLCLPIKANAYGHGLCEIGKAAEEALVDYLAVAHLQEGIILRKHGIQLPILVLGAFNENQIPDLIKFNLEFTISSKFKADLVVKSLPQRKASIHLEVDTGMQRTGVRTTTAKDLFNYILSLDCFNIIGIYSQLATAEQPNNPFAMQQIEAFRTLLQDPIFQSKSLIKHMANSGGVVNFPESYFDMVRPAFLAFGYTSAIVAPCFSLKSHISYFKVVGANQGISYEHTHVTTKSTRIVTVPVGYGDGYLRALSNKGSVLIRGNRFPIVGSICMDQFMVDIGASEAYPGDEVVLIGKQGQQEITLQEIATLCNTTPREILCLFNNRLPKIYLSK
jgi:alanine racemase